MKNNDYTNIPTELKLLDQWVIHNEKKVPLTQNGYASTNNPQTWLTFPDAMSLLTRNTHYGLGFVFSPDDPYIGIDLDNCINNNTWTHTATKIHSALKDTAYCEISPSGHGLHLIVKGDLTPIQWTNTKEIEIYSQGRYFTMTGIGTGTIGEAQTQLKRLFHKPAPTQTHNPQHTRPHPILKSKTPLRDLIQQWGVNIWEEREVEMASQRCDAFIIKCPWQSGHSTPNRQRDTLIAEDSEGRRYFHCFHASCSHRSWRDFRTLYDVNTLSKRITELA